MPTKIVGQSEAIRKALEEAYRLAATDYSIMIQGESGTGKELFAEYIHKHSSRSASMFLPVNIAAYNSNLIDSELFGHEKGAFTGTSGQRIGVFEQVGEGTILLDEIGDLSRNLQVKLLRVLQAKEFQRVGGNKTLPMKARVLAATNVDLEKNVAEGRFREDLFYRFGVTLRVPPLRERPEDIPLLVEHIIQQEEPNLGRTYPSWFGGDCRQKLGKIMGESPYPWPGNIRGLQKVLKALLIECVCYAGLEEFEERVTGLVKQKCRSEAKAVDGELSRLISNLVRDNIATYPLSNTSVRAKINALLVDAISDGLDLALNVDEFRPQSGKEIGDILGIPTLSSSNRNCLPRNENDYIVKALKNLGHRDELPDKVNELIAI
ncbi:MAG: sigma 54-interacting transcriptional regulator [Syntrophomonas sp.]|nr:sigma 54-interacting transcriptional regulator [Syntrophomonas sp.]